MRLCKGKQHEKNLPSEDGRFFSLSINPVEGVGGPQPSDSCSEPSDMRGGFGSLAKQGFLAGFSGRERSEQEKPVSAEKIAQRAFSTV